jgi:DNA-binding response OmpR family regulator
MTTAKAKKILVVDDDAKVRTLLRRCFEGEGFDVFEAANGTELYAELDANEIDLITLDLNLGGDDGLTLARDIRARLTIPIVMVTGKGDMVDKVVGLELGADDYILKPFHLREVLARIRSVLRRCEPAQPRSNLSSDAGKTDRVQFDQYTLNKQKRELQDANGEIIPLTTNEFQMLDVFVRHPNKVLSRDQLMDQIKGHDWTPLDRSIDNQVSRLRKKLSQSQNPLNLIKTVRGIGYVFTADITHK